MLDTINRVFDKIDALPDDEFFALLNKERDDSVKRALVEANTL